MLSTLRRRGYPEETLPIGTTYTITQSGTWECPATGTWQVELHGGGGGNAILTGRYTRYAAGGGSGEIYTNLFTKGNVIQVVIGDGGSGKTISNDTVSGNSGGVTSFDTLSVSGGGGGKVEYMYIGSNSIAFESGGTASGSLATQGGTGSSAIGGYGNKDNTAQTYGNGASISGPMVLTGNPGAVILTYLGK